MKTAWLKYQNNLGDVMAFNDKYMDYLSNCKTERESVIESEKIAQDLGFVKFEDVKGPLKQNDKVYFTNKEKNIALFVIGKELVSAGINILGAHIDSPRIDVKQNPLYEDEGLALLDTHYYGGIKKYHWVATPLAIHGVVCKMDGSKVTVNIGEDDSDPVLNISDLLPHLGKDQMQKKASVVIEGEDLNVLIGSIPAFTEDESEKELVKKNILTILKNKYDMEEDDFMSAELELVPAGKARSLGLDSSMVIGYGHDDRVCAYTSLMALVESKDLERTACAILVDKEEVGSAGATGAQSRFFENIFAELIANQEAYSDLKLRRALKASFMLSSDVSAGYDSNYAAAFEKKNTAFLGKGLCFNKYTGARGKSGCNDANPEYIAKIRKVMKDNNITIQSSELGKVDQGGGGTIAYILANLEVDVIDAGIAVQNMHAPWEVVSKVDVYEAYLGYKAFLKDIK